MRGTSSETVPAWLEREPQTIIAMCDVVDMDLYEPTKNTLERIIPHLTKGSILVFDELNDKNFPGETQAVQEVLGINNLGLKRFPFQTNCAWTRWGE